MTEIKAKYKEMYKKDLEKAVQSETSGDYKRILISCIQANRSTNKKPNNADMEAKAKELYNAGAGKKGTDEEVFNRIFATSSAEEIKTIAQFYHKLTGKTILQAIDSEFSGNIKKALRAVVYSQLSPHEFYAERLNDAMKGAGTKDKQLIRIIIARDEIDMPQIKSYYKQLYKKDLIDAIKSETSGDYKRIMVELADH